LDLEKKRNNEELSHHIYLSEEMTAEDSLPPKLTDLEY